MKELSKKEEYELYFKRYRNFWWNSDFLELMAKRWQLNTYSSMIDLGCGLCHWSKLLIPYLKKYSQVIGVDNDFTYGKGNNKIKEYFAKHNSYISFKIGDATEIDVEDNSFDVVTCQTLLIHLKKPQKAIQEMFRIARPGGIVICVEPNNLITTLLMDSLKRNQSLEVLTDEVKGALFYEKGREKKGDGDNTIGDCLPEMFQKAGLRNIKMFLSDKTIPLLPPYDSEEQQAMIQAIRESLSNREIKFSKANSQNYFTALGKNYPQFFPKYWANFKTKLHKINTSIEQQKYFGIISTMMFLISGEK